MGLSNKGTVFGIFILLTVFGCKTEHDIEYSFGELENVKVFTENITPDSVVLTNAKEFGDNEEVFFASMGDFTVDDSGRVYIADAGWGSRSLYVFNAEGSHLKKIAGEGKGPGEFLNLSNLQYRSGSILFYDSQMQRIMIYSTDSLQLEKTVLTDAQKWQSNSDLEMKRPHEFYLDEGNNVIAEFQEPPQANKSGIRKKYYYRLNSELELISEQLVELNAKKFAHSESPQNVGDTQVRLMKHFPFFERHFIIPTQADHFFIVDSREFLIKRYDGQGNYQDAFYYPYIAPDVTREDAMQSVNEMVKSIASDIDLPDKWPAINNIYLDDESRFWVSTITESHKYFRWWVLDESGELLARFTMPGDKYQDPASKQNKVIVKDGYLYQQEKDEKTNQWKVVRYEIELLAR